MPESTLTAGAGQRVLLLLPTSTYHARDFIEAAERIGVEVTVGSDLTRSLPHLQPSRMLALDLTDADAAAEEIARFARDHPLRAIVPTDDRTSIVAAVASARLGLRHNPPEAARTSRHKYRLRTALRAAGVPTPRACLLSTEGDPEAIARRQSYPCVLKPTFLSAGRGVIRADTPEEFAAAFDRIRAILRTPEVSREGGEAAREILVDDYVPGFEVALEGLLVRGHLKVLALFDKPDPLEGPFFEETLYVTPSRLPAGSQTAIRAVAAEAARAIGLSDGPVHAELRLNDEGPWVIELAARSIGGLCSCALRFSGGLSLPELLIMHAVGREVASIEREPAATGVMMIPIPRRGILREIRGLADAKRVAGVTGVTVSATIGRPLIPLPEGWSYLGFIYARAETPDRVEESLREAHRRLVFEVDDEPSATSLAPPSVKKV